ncbi:MAG: hypothetical protein QM599_10215 [Pseudoxanthomonas sp.]
MAYARRGVLGAGAEVRNGTIPGFRATPVASGRREAVVRAAAAVFAVSRRLRRQGVSKNGCFD